MIKFGTVKVDPLTPWPVCPGPSIKRLIRPSKKGRNTFCAGPVDPGPTP
jgi:hypothetical protein